MAEQRGWFELADARLYYEATGSGPVITFIHAGIADSRMWDDQVAYFAPNYRVIRYDVRGYGQTRATVTEGYLDIADLDALLTFLNVDKTVLVGLSRGAMIALDYTLAHPERVIALVEAAPGLDGFEVQPTPDEDAFITKLMAVYETGDIDQMNALEIQLWLDGLRRVGPPPSQAIRDKMLEMNGLASRHPDGQHKPAKPPVRSLDHLTEVKTPTLVMWGTADMKEIEMVCDELVSSLPNVQEFFFTDTAHMLNLEHPDKFNARIQAFIEPILKVRDSEAG